MTEYMNEDVKRAIISRRSVRKFLPTEISKDICLLYTSPSPRDATLSRMPSSA